ncbi:MAG: radical SAM protein [Oceanicaulis sp.]
MTELRLRPSKAAPSGPAPQAPGYAAANCIADYTQQIDYADDQTAIFNLATGRYWTGARVQADGARRAVEETRGGDSAHDRLTGAEDGFLKMQAEQPRKTAIVLLPTYGCNLGCTYCYEGKLTRRQAYWSEADARTAAQASLAFLKERGVSAAEASLTILGGEPVRHDNIDALCALMSAACEGGLNEIQLITNGVDLAPHAGRLHAAGARSVMISLDGPKAVHDKRRPRFKDARSSYEDSIKGVAAALEAGLGVTIRVNTDGSNVATLVDLGMEFHRHGFWAHPDFRAYIYPISSDFRTNRKFTPEAELAQALAQTAADNPILHAFLWELHGLEAVYAIRNGEPLRPKLRYCGATLDQYVMDIDWNIYPCWFGTGKDGFKLGEFDPGSGRMTVDGALDRAWRSRGPASMEPCSSCKWAMVCGAGCAFKSHLRTGDFAQPNCSDFDAILQSAGRALLEA